MWQFTYHCMVAHYCSFHWGVCVCVCVCVWSVSPAAQVRKHREALESERSSWRRERNSLQEELGRLRGVVSSKVKLNLQSPTDSLEASMKKVRGEEGRGGGGEGVVLAVLAFERGGGRAYRRGAAAQRPRRQRFGRIPPDDFQTRGASRNNDAVE